MKIDYDKLLTTAERVHIRILQVLNVFLTIALWFLVLGGGFVIYSWFHSGFRISNVVLTILLFLIYFLFWALLIWMCLLCKRLRIAKRLLVWLFLWIPVVNFGLALYVKKLAKQEIDHTLYKIKLDEVRVEKQICSTRYPLLLVHGVGFRDFHYFNYWARIPRELVRNGAKVYYGHQEAWGTVEDNGQILREKIQEILKETGCEKVNIIAHSKGGLDSRYVISGLGMAPFVASLTTINTPHRGSKLVDFLKKLPDKVYWFVCRIIDLYFGRLGDKNPNAYAASYQLSHAYAKEFNENYPDAEGVYYQSYASLMKNGLSSKLLCIPYWVLKALDAPSDGLVTVESAAWTNFQGVVTNRYLRGISHGDMIDLTREDYKGFGVLEFYIQLAAGLKESGF